MLKHHEHRTQAAVNVAWCKGDKKAPHAKRIAPAAKCGAMPVAEGRHVANDGSTARGAPSGQCLATATPTAGNIVSGALQGGRTLGRWSHRFPVPGHIGPVRVAVVGARSKERRACRTPLHPLSSILVASARCR